MAIESRNEYSRPAKFFYWVGLLFLRSLPGQLLSLFFRSFRALLTDNRRRKTESRQIILQTYFTGIEAIPLIALVATLLGSVTILQALTVMPKVGFGDFFGSLMVIVIIRELGPILTAFLIAGRTGSALAAFIGNMKVESEVDALETMGIDPVRYLVMPALIGGMIALLILNVLFSTIAIGAGYLVAKTTMFFMRDMLDSQLQWGIFYQAIVAALSPMDFVMVIVKPLIFGAIITTNACYFGASIRNDVREVPKATSKSVVFSFVFIVVSDLVLSLVYIAQYMRDLSKVI